MNRKHEHYYQIVVLIRCILYPVRKSFAKVHEYSYMQRLLEGGVYFIQLLTLGQYLLEGSVCLRAVFIGINTVCEYVY